MLRLVAAFAAFAALAGCASGPSLNPLTWFTTGSGGPKPAALEPIAGAPPVRVLWSAAVGGAGAFVFSPAHAVDSVFAAARDGTVVRLDASSGQVRWRVSIGSPLSAGVGSDGKLVVVANEEGEVFALEAESGAVAWRARASSEVLAAPAVSEGLVLVRSADSRIFAFGASDGKRRWVYQRPAAALIVRSPTGVTIHQGLAIAGFSGGKLVALSLTNGALRWEVTVAQPKGATELERVTDIVGNPAAQGREACAVAFQGRVACYELQSGSQQWTREISSVSGVSLDARYAFVSDDRGAVQAFDRSGGRSLWKQDRLAHRQLSLPLQVGGEVVVGDLEGFLHFLSRDSGAFVARAATDGSAVRAAPLRLSTGVLVQTRNGGLYAVSLQ